MTTEAAWRRRWRAVYAAQNAAAWRARADELRRQADICDARARSRDVACKCPPGERCPGCWPDADKGACAGRTYLERGKPVTVLVGWRGKGPRNVLIERCDGSLTVRPFRGLRRAH